MKQLLPIASIFLLACGSTGSADDTSGDGGSPGTDGSKYGSDGNSGSDGSQTDGGGTDGNNGVDGSTGPLQTVFIILMETHGWASVSGSASAKYIKGTLVPAGGH